jgi:protein-disulfide isomerase
MEHNTHKKNSLSKIFSFTNTLIILVLALIAFFIWNKADTVIKESLPVTVNLSVSDHKLGNPNAKVTVIEFADMQCPACKAFDPIVTSVIAEYSDRVNFIFKHFPLTAIHQNAILGAIATEAAGAQGKFWEMKKALYENQADWSTSLDSKNKVVALAVSIGLNKEKFEADLLNKDLEEKVLADLKEATTLKLGGTPSFIINNIKVETSELGSVEKFKAYLDKELAK